MAILGPVEEKMRINGSPNKPDRSLTLCIKIIKSSGFLTNFGSTHKPAYPPQSAGSKMLKLREIFA